MMIIVKRRVLCMVLLMSMGFSKPGDVLVLGHLSSPNTWVYLCGLTETINSDQEVENRQLLNQLGKKLNIRFLAIHPFDRCEKVSNKLCWAHYTDEQALETYEKILGVLPREHISGFIGFSNGGFFLNCLAQLKEFPHPIICVGAAGSVKSPSIPNKITLVVGKLEVIYDFAHAFVKKAKGSPLSVTLIEHEGDHVLPSKTLEKLMKKREKVTIK